MCTCTSVCVLETAPTMSHSCSSNTPRYLEDLAGKLGKTDDVSLSPVYYFSPISFLRQIHKMGREGKSKYWELQTTSYTPQENDQDFKTKRKLLSIARYMKALAIQSCIYKIMPLPSVLTDF